jgi:N-methylhydantoinase A
MGVRIGVDVGGTFTKAVAIDMATGKICGQSSLPTTHTADGGVAAGVVEVVTHLASQVGAACVDLVTHSTTQAVNALLEGDVGIVGMVGMGRAPDLRKARSRTVDPRIDLADGHRLQITSEFIDVTNGLDRSVALASVQRLHSAGAGSIAVAAAYSTDDTTCEDTVAEAAAELGLPVTTSAELTGLYGLELRAVTAALNASILPIAVQTARTVRSGVRAAGITAPIMVMRGDAGATDLANFERHPARTLYSGPAASVAGVVRTCDIADAVILEVGGTSSNIAAIRRGRPALSYVRIDSHSTALRALDVQVVGVAGGSMLRSRRGRVYGVGPRSAHIAGLPYACFLQPADFEGARVELVAPCEGDVADYLVLALENGSRVALTLTCAANALGEVAEHDHAHGSREAAAAAFAVAGAFLKLSGDEVARRMLEAAVQVVGDVITDVIKSSKLESPTIVAVGGGAGGLGRAVAGAMRLPIAIPEHADVMSAIGDALSLIRCERERTLVDPSPADLAEMVSDAENEAIAAGGSAASLEVHVEHLAERSAVRVVVTGSVGLDAGAKVGREAVDRDVIARRSGQRPERYGEFWLTRSGSQVAVYDRYGDVALSVSGETVTVIGSAEIAEGVRRHTRGHGALVVEPGIWLLSDRRMVKVPTTEPAAVLDFAQQLGGPGAALIIGTE